MNRYPKVIINALAAAAACFFALGFSSCATEEMEASLSYSPTSVSVGSTGGSFEIAVSATIGYSVSVSGDWLVLSSGGSELYELSDGEYFCRVPGSAVLGFTAESNTSSSTRTATITLSAGDITNSILVTQAGISLSVSPTTVSVAAAGESFTMSVTCDTDYSVDISDDWLTLNSNSSGTLSFTADANTSGSSRTATITITAGDLSETVTVTQAGISLSVSPTTVSVAAAGESFTVSVTCDTDYSVDISDTWLTMNSNSSGTLSFTAEANTSGSSRTATITITAGDLSETVTVTQAGISLSVSPTTVSVDAAGESFTVTVTCDTDYSVDISDDWLTLNSNSSGTLSFTAAANTSGSSRTATITITAGDLSETVTVTQAGISLSVSPTTVSVAAAGESFTVSVTCDTDYSVDISDDWLTLNSNSSGTLSFTADTNTSGSSRTATITITAGDLSETVTVTQVAADDEDDSDDLSDNDASGTINGYEYVDLGLSVKWASYNVGASSPEEYGNYYAWGETETKSSYTSSNSVTYGGKDDISGDSEYDVATVKWGSAWRMPTSTEIGELVDDCTWTWTTQNDVYGYEVTGTNGNSVFIPAAGYYSSSSLSGAGTYGYYWSASPNGTSNACELFFTSSKVYNSSYTSRYYGLPIRPVSDDESDASSGTINGYAYVDLGLSVLWATCNIGADSPEEYGDYYAWGEIETKETYTSSNSTYYGKSIDYGDIGGDAEYDAATANWGSPWRMPTSSEIEELISNCTWAWTTYNGVNGYDVIGTNGNSIFLPAAGYRSSSSLYNAGSLGNYWGSTPYSSGPNGAYYLLFSSSSVDRNFSGYRYLGRSVRPVSE